MYTYNRSEFKLTAQDKPLKKIKLIITKIKQLVTSNFTGCFIIYFHAGSISNKIDIKKTEKLINS